MPRLFLLAIIILGTSTVIAACGSSRATRYYVLAPLSNLDGGNNPAGTRDDPAIGIGPVKFPKYLDRPQIVTRSSRNQIDIGDFDQWAEPLKNNFTNVIAENLSVLIPRERIVVFPWSRSTPVGHQVLIEVTRFEGELGGDSLLTARWSILGKDKKRVLSRRTSNFTETSNGSGFKGTVSAMNRTLEELSREIAAALKALSKQ